MRSTQIHTSAGVPLPLGPSWQKGYLNLALFCRHGLSVYVVMQFDDEQPGDDGLIELALDPACNRTGDIWHIGLQIGERRIRYGFRIEHQEDIAQGMLSFPDKIVVDPYCPSVAARPWAARSRAGRRPVCVAARPEPFDWQGDRPLQTPLAETIIYELHVRGFTNHPSAATSHPGTFLGLIEKIDYLKDLGVTAVELLPVSEWDETDNKFVNPHTGAALLNYWGYNPLSFFALRSGLAAEPENHLHEFKTMVRSLHQAGIEVILDVVFNHTGESDYQGITSSFRAIDNPIYYLVDEADGDYRNYTGCGNTLNCNHPVVRKLILDALHYLVGELHVDGFRFDLAAIFSRGSDGEPLESAPLIEMIAEDPLLSSTKIIAEAWDAAGLYQVGSFSSNPRWLEWNGRFRDDVRRFMAAHPDSVRTLATRLAGSSDLYQGSGRGPLNSINFITCHDGFTLMDLVSYSAKRNEANGEQNLDGENHNLSWNSGHEGIPAPAEVTALRFRRIRTFAALLIFSQGVPMICAGDEFGRSQAGNNNSWCQDSEWNWLDWNLARSNRGLVRFFQKCIGLRRQHRVFRRDEFFNGQTEGQDLQTGGIHWQALAPGVTDWSASSRVLALLLDGSTGGDGEASSFFMMINGHTDQSSTFTIAAPPPGQEQAGWYRIIDTAAPPPADFVERSAAQRLAPSAELTLLPMSLVMLQTGT
jgi:isoamylase